MCKAFRITIITAAVGIAALSLTAPAHAGNGSAVGAGIVGFGVGAILGSALPPQAVYVAPPPPPVYYVPPPPVYYGAVVYGPPYRYGYYRHRHR
jgi:hypothetical protein